MKNTMEYKGYVGNVEFSEEDEVFFGKVIGIRSLISYEGATAKELIKDFHDAVDAFARSNEMNSIKICQKIGFLEKFMLTIATYCDKIFHIYKYFFIDRGGFLIMT